MKNNSRFIKPLVILLILLFHFPRDAQAYLDPGTGSYILQIALAAIFGGLLAIKLFWSRIKNFLKSKFKGKSS